MANDKIEVVKMNLKSATKLKINIERDLYQARNKERSLNEKIATEKAEIEFLKEQLADVKSQIAQVRHQISMVEICSTSEKSKIEGHFANLERHKKGFQELFARERELFDIRMKEIQEKEADEEELLRQKESVIAEKSKQEAREAAAIEAECEALERECTILRYYCQKGCGSKRMGRRYPSSELCSQKRNNAIMMQLRRKLLETENARRELAKRNKC